MLLDVLMFFMIFVIVSFFLALARIPPELQINSPFCRDRVVIINDPLAPMILTRHWRLQGGNQVS